MKNQTVKLYNRVNFDVLEPIHVDYDKIYHQLLDLPNNNGIAHMCKHCNFMNRKNGKIEIPKEIVDLMLNLSTDKDKMNSFTVIFNDEKIEIAVYPGKHDYLDYVGDRGDYDRTYAFHGKTYKFTDKYRCFDMPKKVAEDFDFVDFKIYEDGHLIIRADVNWRWK